MFSFTVLCDLKKKEIPNYLRLIPHTHTPFSFFWGQVKMTQISPYKVIPAYKLIAEYIHCMGVYSAGVKMKL